MYECYVAAVFPLFLFALNLTAVIPVPHSVLHNFLKGKTLKKSNHF